MLKIIKIHSDGACNNHLERPSMGLGIAVFVEDEYREDLSRAIFVDAASTVKKLTSNVAEWLACIEAMKIAATLSQIGYTCFIYSDSQIITYQFNGDYTINKHEFIEYFNAAKFYAAKAGISKITWIPREQNMKADELSKIGLYGEEGKPKKSKKNV